MGDKELRAAVEQALDWEPIIDAKGVGVAVEDGVVTLSGHVPTYAEKREAEKVAGLVRGVKAVACGFSNEATKKSRVQPLTPSLGIRCCRKTPFRCGWTGGA